LLRQYGHHLGLGPRFTVLDQADCEQIIRRVLEERDLRPKGDKRFPKAGSLVDLMSRARNQELSLEDLVEEHASHLRQFLPAIGQAAQGYAQAKADQDLADFDDLLYMTERLLRDFPEVRDALHRRWEHLLVDEYQDTNAVQARLVELLAGERKNVMAVGDDAQSIYRFRGARIKNILEFPRRFPGTRLVKLEQNYRSTQPILDLTNRIIEQAAQQYQKHLFTERGGGPRPLLLRPRDDEGQSRRVLERIEELARQGTPLSHMAVLFRASNDSFGLEGKLTAAGLPYVKHGGRRFLEAAHIKDALSHLRVLANPLDHLSWERLLLLLPGVGPKKARQITAFLSTSPLAQEPGKALAGLPASLRGPGFGDLLALLERLTVPEIAPDRAMEAVLDYYEPLCKLLYEDHPRRLR
ncbi:MAG: hypothetical protein C0405_13340, partial [Desulfovibrio sp.]|nr:hypothetical protein [Desulfovibrio sp.]